MDALIDETGPVLMGRRTFEMAEDPDWYVANYEFQVRLRADPRSPGRRAEAGPGSGGLGNRMPGEASLL
jgi:hypothetical protein